MVETWKAIEGYEGLYEVSTQGRVRNIKRGGRLKALCKVAHGYIAVNLNKEGVKKQYLVHRLVAKAFIPNPENKPQVNHKDGTKSNNSVGNLEWMTSSENLNHARDTGLIPSHPTMPKKDPMSKPNYTAYLWKSNLKELREGNGMSQEELAEVCCVRLDTIKKLEENGMYFRAVGLTTACKLAYALSVSIEALFDYDIKEAIRKEKAWHNK